MASVKSPILAVRSRLDEICKLPDQEAATDPKRAVDAGSVRKLYIPTFQQGQLWQFLRQTKRK